MTYRSFRAEPSTPNIGAEITEIDLTRPLSNLQVSELHQAFAQYQVLFFRDQQIDHRAHVTFARHFGEPYVNTAYATESKALSEFPEVRSLHFNANSEKIAGERWHADQTCNAVPPMASILYLHTLPPDNGGATLFASMYAAYDNLSPRMQKYLEGMTAVHDGRDFGPTAPVTSHPVIARHPVTGKKLIYVDSFVTFINDIPRDESDAIVKFLRDHCANPEWQVRFQWKPHSIAFWDNRCTHHKALWDYYPHTRSGFRIQLNADQPPLAA